MVVCRFDLDPSRAISIADAAQQWQKVGGSVDTTVVAVAVALAESGLDPYATSPTCARGLWQIEDNSYIDGRPTAEQLFDTYNNAYWAHTISSGGRDWGPWDVAYAAGERLTRRYSIPYPERGSKAAAAIPTVVAAIGDATDLAGRGGTYAGQLHKNTHMVARHTPRVSMWKDQLRGVTPGRGNYASALCPNGINYCSNDTAWADCCHSYLGSYHIDVNSAYNYLQGVGFYGDLPFIMLALMQRESGFAPDAVASCAQCCCTEAGVYAVGLLQFETIGHIDLGPVLMGDGFTGWDSLVAWMKNPAYNCAGAKYLYDHGGLDHWTPLNGADSNESIAYWRGQVSAGGSGQPPSTGGLPGIPNPEPQLTTPPDLPQAPPAPTVTPPIHTSSLEYPHLLAEPDYGKWGWEAVNRYFSNDLPYYTGYDADLIRIVNKLWGNEG